jgi:hypothetical protein
MRRYLQGSMRTACAGFLLLAVHPGVTALFSNLNLECARQVCAGRRRSSSSISPGGRTARTPLGRLHTALARCMPAPAALLLLMLAAATYVFSLKMNRLILLLAPPAAALSGAAVGCALDCALFSPIRSLAQRLDAALWAGGVVGEERDKAVGAQTDEARGSRVARGVPSGRLSTTALWCVAMKLVAGGFAVYALAPVAVDFHGACYNFVQYSLSHPQIVKRSGRDTDVLYDDYREAYAWLRHNTRADARVLAWCCAVLCCAVMSPCTRSQAVACVLMRCVDTYLPLVCQSSYAPL